MRWLAPNEVGYVSRPALEVAYEEARKDADGWMTKYYASLEERTLLAKENMELRRFIERLGEKADQGNAA